MRNHALAVAGLLGLTLLTSCGGTGFPIITKPPEHKSAWTWVSGANTLHQTGVYGTKGTASQSNVPGARLDAVTWTDKNGNLWLLGGAVFNFTEFLNDLWKYDGSNWTWGSGANTSGQPGVYGTQGTASPSNVPGARFHSASWIDNKGNLWLFGGVTSNSQGVRFLLNDLWKYDGSNWTWVGGANTSGQPGVYGTQGTASPSNVPGARAGAVYWTDANGNFWLFGGDGLDANVGAGNNLNDLWKFDGVNWTWVNGPNSGAVFFETGIYGTKGTASPSNRPPARAGAVSWIDKSGALWLFGGIGFDSTLTYGLLNDLWKSDGTNWTWVSGADTVLQVGTYGTLGTAFPANVPGARSDSISWTDKGGTLWLFGGTGFDARGADALFNDLWKFDGSNWTWVSGSRPPTKLLCTAPEGSRLRLMCLADERTLSHGSTAVATFGYSEALAPIPVVWHMTISTISGASSRKKTPKGLSVAASFGKERP